MQPAVEELMKLGALPCSQNTNLAKLEKFQNLLNEIEKPISDDEARALILLFGPDDCFGICWALLHLMKLPQAGQLMIASMKQESMDRSVKERAKI